MKCVRAERTATKPVEAPRVCGKNKTKKRRGKPANGAVNVDSLAGSPTRSQDARSGM